MSFAKRLNATFTPDAVQTARTAWAGDDRPGFATPVTSSPLRSAALVGKTLWAACGCGARLALCSGMVAACTSEERAVQAGARRGWRLAEGRAECPACLKIVKKKLLLSESGSRLIASVNARPLNPKPGTPESGTCPNLAPSQAHGGLAAVGGAALRRAKKGNAK